MGKGLGAGKTSSVSSNLHFNTEIFETCPLYIRTQCLVGCEARFFADVRVNVHSQMSLRHQGVEIKMAVCKMRSNFCRKSMLRSA